MDFFIKCVILMAVFTLGPFVLYTVIGIIIAALTRGND